MDKDTKESLIKFFNEFYRQYNRQSTFRIVISEELEKEFKNVIRTSKKISAKINMATSEQ